MYNFVSQKGFSILICDGHSKNFKCSKTQAFLWKTININMQKMYNTFLFQSDLY